MEEGVLPEHASSARAWGAGISCFTTAWLEGLLVFSIEGLVREGCRDPTLVPAVEPGRADTIRGAAWVSFAAGGAERCVLLLLRVGRPGLRSPLSKTNVVLSNDPSSLQSSRDL